MVRVHQLKLPPLSLWGCPLYHTRKLESLSSPAAFESALKSVCLRWCIYTFQLGILAYTLSISQKILQKTCQTINIQGVWLQVTANCSRSGCIMNAGSVWPLCPACVLSSLWPNGLSALSTHQALAQTVCSPKSEQEVSEQSCLQHVHL